MQRAKKRGNTVMLWRFEDNTGSGNLTFLVYLTHILLFIYERERGGERERGRLVNHTDYISANVQRGQHAVLSRETKKNFF